MTNGLPIRSTKRDLRDYELLIENGYVLDVRGQWIPLDEKVKKERSFVKHLESGEVLVSGKWVSISDALKWQSLAYGSLSKTQAGQTEPQKDTDTETHHDETRAGFENDFTGQETDFPPETIMIPAGELLEKNVPYQDSMEKNGDGISIDNQNSYYEESIITQETIAMSLNVLPEVTAHRYRKSYTKKTGTIFSGYSGLSDMEGKRKKRGKMLFILVAGSVVFCLSALLVWTLFPGLFQ